MERKTLLRTEVSGNLRLSEFGSPVGYQPVGIKVLVCFFGVLGAVVAVWLVRATFNTTVTARGSLVPEAGIVKVYAKHRGMYAEIKVHDGQRVSKGEVLAIIADEVGEERDRDPPMLAAMAEDREKLRQTVDRQKLLHTAAIDELNDDYESAVAELELIDQESQYEQQLLELNRQQLSSDETLLKNGSIPVERVLPKRSAVADAQRRNLELRRERQKLSARINAHQRSVVQESLKFRDRENGLYSRLLLMERQGAANGATPTLSVVAPIDGIVAAVTVHRMESVTDSPLLSIIPAGSEFGAELYVNQYGLGGVRVGEPIYIEFDAYKLQSYGNYKAVVTSIGEAPIDPRQHLLPVFELDGPVYLVRARLERQFIGDSDKPIPLRAGMQFSAGIVTDSRSIIANIFAPITNIQKRL